MGDLCPFLGSPGLAVAKQASADWRKDAEAEKTGAESVVAVRTGG